MLISLFRIVVGWSTAVVHILLFAIYGGTDIGIKATMAWVPSLEPMFPSNIPTWRKLAASSNPKGITDVDPMSKLPQTNTLELSDSQRDFVIGYINKHHEKFSVAIVTAFSTIGTEMAQANVWSGGSYIIESAQFVDVSLRSNDITVNVTIQRRGQSSSEHRVITIPLDAQPIPERRRSYDMNSKMIALSMDSAPKLVPTTPVDDVVRQLCRLCWIVREPSMTGKLIQLAIQLGGIGVGKLPDNMYLNQVPHNRYVRQWFYDKASTAIHDSVLLASQGKITNRQKVVTLFPETNPSMDSYRIGTLLELVRTVAIRLVEENLRVRICVQASMGVGIFTGIPKQLTGVARLLQAMDWQSEPGEENEGILGEYVRFGAVGPEHVLNTVRDTYNDTLISQHQDDVFLVLAPQSMVGTDTSIIPLLSGMLDAAGDRPFILFNADLTDKISAAGQQSVRGRQARIDFAQSFQTVFHFQNIYVSGTSYFPILGAITKLHPEEPWIAHQRRDYANDGGEVYIPVLAGESCPDGEMILSAFEK